MYVATYFNARQLFQRLSGWLELAPGEAQRSRGPKLEEFLFRAMSVRIGIHRMDELAAECVREFTLNARHCKVLDDRIVFWSPALVALLNELPPALSALRAMQNLVLPMFATGRGSRVSVPKSLREAVKTLHSVQLPEAMRRRVLVYWQQGGGNTLKEYRDLDQHYSAVVRHTFLQVAPTPRVLVVLPDNPEARAADKFTYTREINGPDFVRVAFEAIHALVEDLARIDGAAPSPLAQSVGLAQLGELQEGVSKTLALFVDQGGDGHALVVGQTEDRRITMQQVPATTP